MRIVCFVILLLPYYLKSQPLFTLLPAEKTGIKFQNSIRESSTQNVLAYEYFYNGGGVAVGDLNGDGLPDIVFTANMEKPKVYFNKGNFNFEDVSSKSKIKGDGWKTGVTMADVNSDGWLDVYICRSGKLEDDERRNLLYINQKNGTFIEQAAVYGIDDKGYSTQATFFDYDRDGDMDLYLLNHPVKRYTRFDVAWMKAARDSLAGDKLYRNDNGHFADVSVAAGIIGNPIGFGLSIAVSDFNNDGWSDMYVSNDYDEDDYLYINQKNGTFKESATQYFGHTSKFSMGSDVGDINNDALPDLLTLDMLPEDNKRQKLLKGPDGYDFFQMLLRNGYGHQYMRNMLHIASQNNSELQYSEVGQLAGISNTDWSWSALFGDYDLDGWQDLFITNGYMRDYTNMDFLKFTAPEAIKKARDAGTEPDLLAVVRKMPSSDVKNYLFRNNGDLTFENKSINWGMDVASLSNGAAYADFDNDGDLDIVVNNINQPAFIWQNGAEKLNNHFLKIKFAGSGLNPFGIGAKVLVSDENGFQQLQQLQLSRGFQSSVEPVLLFGLGKRSTVTVNVTWPDGKQQTVKQQKTDQTITLEYAKAEVVPPTKTENKALFVALQNTNITYKHIEDDFNDFKQEPLLPHQFSKYGPALAKGDINGDGKEDFFIGGAKGQPGAVYINSGNGSFSKKEAKAFVEHSSFEDVEALFADFNGDAFLDLYVVSGGNESNFEDRIYWNDGKGNFTFKEHVLPATTSSGGVVVAFDVDGDGDLDIFRGGQVSSGAYPAAPRSYLFQNNGGVYSDISADYLKNIGMVNTAAVADMNKDERPDLVLAGEYMPITILFGQPKAPFFSSSAQLQIPNSSGWWNCLEIEDMDGDGIMDIVSGNHGLNSPLKPSAAQPLTIDAADVDNNGSLDCIISYYIQGKSYPMPSRDELLDQIPALKTKFPSYGAYATATVKDIFGEEAFEKALHLKAEEFRSGVFFNNIGTFNLVPFPNEAQAFPVRDFIIGDYNKDGKKDLLLVGNDYAVRAQSGKYDAGKGLLLTQGKNKSFKPLVNTGFIAEKDARRIIQIDNFLIVANNNDEVQLFKIN